ncbi:MAG: DoxX family protein [Janthinobacterium lividum]
MRPIGPIALLSRLCLVVLFPFSALDKVMNWNQALKQADSGPLPGGPALLAAAIIIESVTPACIVTGRSDRAAASVLAMFCVATAVLYHPFWSHDDLLAKGKSKGREELWEFLKNFGLVGGLLMVIFADRSEPGRIAERLPMPPRPTLR